MKLSTIAMIMLLQPAAVLAYYGTPSFSIDQDPDYIAYQDKAKVAKVQLAEIEQRRDQHAQMTAGLERDLEALRAQLKTLPQDKEAAFAKIQELTGKIAALKTEIPALEAQYNQIKAENDQYATQYKIATAAVEKGRVELRQISAECSANPSEACSTKLSEKTKELITLEETFQASKTAFETAKAKLDAARAPVEAKKADLTKSESSLVDANKRYAELVNLEQNARQREIGLANQVQVARQDLVVFVKKAEGAQIRMQEAGRNFQLYRDDLMRSVDQINTEGYNFGFRDGNADGSDLSRQMGYDYGRFDGLADGRRDGTIDGRARDYKRGADVGETEGRARGISEGQRDGTLLGSKAGHTEAGRIEGSNAGVDRANKSDAAIVGTKQGEKDGLGRADRVGLEVGSAKGEKEGISLYEDSGLSSVEIKGQFLGSFEKRSPQFPTDFKGKRFQPVRQANKEVLRRAYTDGYLYKYSDEAQLEFRRRIDSDYGPVYDQANREGYRETYGANYQDSYDQGRIDQDKVAYKREYTPAKDAAYKAKYAETSQTPDRQNTDYKTSYRSNELSAYNSQYEVIRSANYSKTEVATYNSNVGARTEEYRQKRLAEAKAVYENNAVVDYVSSGILDYGIDNVGKNDGVFMPGEKMVRTIVIKNFGKKELVGAKAQFATGEEVTLPNIPGRSIVTILNGAVSTITAKAPVASYKDHMRFLAPLTSKDSLQSRHYEDVSKNLLKALDSKEVRIQYPLEVSSLTLSESFALINKKQALKATISNVSKREYKDEIEVVTSASSSVVSKNFSSLKGLQGSLNISDAEVFVTEERDTYSKLSIGAELKIKGVKVGELAGSLDFMARAPYVEKANKVVLVTNSNVNSQDLVQALDKFGGIKEVSVLDYALGSLNADAVSKGLQNKVAVIVDDGAGNVTKDINALLASSVNSMFIHADQNQRSVEAAGKLEAFKESQSIPFIPAAGKEEKRIHFTNMHRTSIKGMTMHVQSTLEKSSRDVVLFKEFALPNTELIAKVKSDVNRTTFFAPQQIIQTAALKAIGETMVISRAYDKSGNIFTRDKKWVKMISEDQNLVHNQFKAAANGAIDEATVGLHLAHIAFKDIEDNSLQYYSPVSKDMMSKISGAVSDVLNDTEKAYKKNLRNFDSKLSDKAYAQNTQHRPYQIDVPETNF